MISWSRRIAVALAVLTAGAVAAPAAEAVVVEAFVAEASAPLVVSYAVDLGGEEVPEAVTLTFASDSGDQMPPLVMERSDTGIFLATARFPGSAMWTVTVSFTGDGPAELSFPENLPWPHYSEEAGRPKVKFDSDRPERVGALIPAEESIYLRATAAYGEEEPAANGEGSVIAFQVLLRLAHLAAVALWLAPLLATALGRALPRATLPVTGLMATVATGVMLALWGAPVAYPGVLRWSELAGQFFGPSYQAVFLTKMGAVVVAVGATLWWAGRRDRRALSLLAGSVGAAVIAVVAMIQFHSLAHL